MRINLKLRSKELEELREKNTEELEKNKAKLEKLNAEIQNGSFREIAISNRLDEIANVLKGLDQQETEEKSED